MLGEVGRALRGERPRLRAQGQGARDRGHQTTRVLVDRPVEGSLGLGAGAPQTETQQTAPAAGPALPSGARFHAVGPWL